MAVYPDSPDATVGPDGTRWTFAPCVECGVRILNVKVGAPVHAELLCMTCGYEKRFGEKGETMAKKKDANGHGAHPKASAKPKGPVIPSSGIERARYEEKLPCRVGDAQVTAKALELAKLEHQRTAFRESWKAQCAKARERRSYFEERIEELANEVDGQVEYRNVEVADYLMPDNSVRTIRLDTREVVGERAADADDLQDEMFDTRGIRDEGGDEARP